MKSVEVILGEIRRKSGRGDEVKQNLGLERERELWISCRREWGLFVKKKNFGERGQLGCCDTQTVLRVKEKGRARQGIACPISGAVAPCLSPFIFFYFLFCVLVTSNIVLLNLHSKVDAPTLENVPIKAKNNVTNVAKI